MHGDSYVFIGILKDMIKKHGLEAYHRYLVDGTIPKEEDK